MKDLDTLYASAGTWLVRMAGSVWGNFTATPWNLTQDGFYKMCCFYFH